MRGLRKYLTPFAPDQSGAVSVLYEFGGIIVICDAGGSLEIEIIKLFLIFSFLITLIFLS